MDNKTIIEISVNTQGKGKTTLRTTAPDKAVKFLMNTIYGKTADFEHKCLLAEDLKIRLDRAMDHLDEIKPSKSTQDEYERIMKKYAQWEEENKLKAYLDDYRDTDWGW